MPPGAGLVTGDIGSRSVTHAECGLLAEQPRSFKVRSSLLVPDLLVLPDVIKSEQRRRVLGVVAAVSVMALAGVSVLLFTGEDNEGTTRITGNLQPTATVEQPPTTVATEVAGVVEQRLASTIAVVPVAVAPTPAPATSAVPTSNEVLVVPPTAPQATAPSPTAPPPTLAPTTVPVTAPPTSAPPPPTTAAPPTTTTRPPATTTTTPPATTITRRKGILGL